MATFTALLSRREMAVAQLGRRLLSTTPPARRGMVVGCGLVSTRPPPRIAPLFSFWEHHFGCMFPAAMCMQPHAICNSHFLPCPRSIIAHAFLVCYMCLDTVQKQRGRPVPASASHPKGWRERVLLIPHADHQCQCGGWRDAQPPVVGCELWGAHRWAISPRKGTIHLHD